jgi:Family of unknown function (DUF6433)
MIFRPNVLGNPEAQIRKKSLRKSLSEILKLADQAQGKQGKIDILRQYDCSPLRTILTSCYSPNVNWLLPKGEPAYTPSDLTDIETRLYQETKHLYLFVEGGNPNLTPLKRQSIFVQILETVTPDDAKLLIGCKDGQLPYKTITKKLVNEAFPGIF